MYAKGLDGRHHFFISENTTLFATFRCLSVMDRKGMLMANIRKLASGHWRVQIRLKVLEATETLFATIMRASGRPKRRIDMRVESLRPAPYLLI
jgi:hypothetical protein